MITGRPWEGKTFFATFLTSFYSRIYSNIEIERDWKKITTYIANIRDIKKIRYSDVKGVILLDEGGINVNARRSGSEENKEYGELAMLSRKYNVDIIICAQLKRMVDVYYRELSNYVFEMHAWYERYDYLMFETKIFGGWGENVISCKTLDLFKWSALTETTYNTLDNSRIQLNPSEPPPGRKESKKEAKQVKKQKSPIWTTPDSQDLIFGGGFLEDSPPLSYT